MNLSIRDRQLIWHPLTQEKNADFPIPIVRAQGAFLYDEDNNRYLDLISSWWVNLHGHSHPQIAKAIYDQALKLEHVIFAGFTHEPAVKLCEELSKILPSSLNKFFFSDNGSTAIEVAIKISYQFWQNIGQKERRLFLSFEGGYHGDTFGAMSVGKSSHFHKVFQKLFFEVFTIPFPATFDGDVNVEQKEIEALATLTNYLEKFGSSIAAFIAEPLIQGASGMRICRPSFLNKVIQLVKAYDIKVIFDEIMTGFGRTGALFAYMYLEEEPDIICLSKGLTGGFLPLALTVVTQKIYQAFLSNDYNKAFLHSHSYTANPIGCAAAIASLKLLVQDSTQFQINKIAEIHRTSLIDLANFDFIRSIRQIGTIAAFDFIHPKISIKDLQNKLIKAGFLIRPLGNTIYLLPPYCISEEDLMNVYDTIKKILANMDN